MHKTPEQTIKGGGLGIIQCSALGNPAPQFKWIKNNRTISQDWKFTQLANGSLAVERIDKCDSGTYTCTIKQSRGTESTSEKSQSIIVRVIGRVRKKHRYLDVLNNQYKVKE